MKTYLVGGTMDTLLLDDAVAWSLAGTLAMARCVMWMAVRYVFAAHRHIFALRAGTRAQINLIRRYQCDWVWSRCEVGARHERHVLLQKLGDSALEVHSRIAAIDDTLRTCDAEIRTIQEHLQLLPQLCELLNIPMSGGADAAAAD